MSAEQRIRELAAGLDPVAPLPPLRRVAAAAVAIWLGVAGIEWLLGGPGPRRDGAWGEPGFLGVLAGLAAVAVGATAAALASSVPGRERLARLGWGLAALGAAGLGLFFVATASGSVPAGPFWLPWFCIGRSAWLGLLPAAFLAAFAGRAFAARAAPTAAAAALGAVALGALTVQLSCLNDGALHVCVGHIAGPALLAAALAVPCLLWLRHRRAAGANS